MSAPVAQADYSLAALAELLDDQFPIDSDEERDAIAEMTAQRHAKRPQLTPYDCCFDAYLVRRAGG